MRRPRSWKALDWCFTAGNLGRSVESYVGDLLGPLECDGQPDSVYRGEREESGRLRLTLDGECVGASFEEQAIVNLLLWSINQQVSRRTTRSVLVHAAAVALDGKAVILPGRSGSGKSTLAAALVAAGWDYLTDEASAIDLATGMIRAYPRPIGLKPGSWSALPGAEPVTPHASPPYTVDVWHVDPLALRPDSIIRSALPALIVFPTFRLGEGTTTSRLRPAETAINLAHNNLNLAVVGQPGLERLARVSQSAGGFLLQHDDLDRAVETLHGLLEIA